MSELKVHICEIFRGCCEVSHGIFLPEMRFKPLNITFYYVAAVGISIAEKGNERAKTERLFDYFFRRNS